MLRFPGAPKRFATREEKLASKCRELTRLIEIKDAEIAKLNNDLEKSQQKNFRLEKELNEKNELLGSYDNPSNN